MTRSCETFQCEDPGGLGVGGGGTHHARPGVLPDERVPQHLGQLAGSERSVRFVPSQSSNALLEAGGGIDVGKSATQSKRLSLKKYINPFCNHFRNKHLQKMSSPFFIPITFNTKYLV